MSYDFEDFDLESRDAVFYMENGEERRAMRCLGRACALYGKNADEAAEECRTTLASEPSNAFLRSYEKHSTRAS